MRVRAHPLFRRENLIPLALSAGVVALVAMARKDAAPAAAKPDPTRVELPGAAPIPDVAPTRPRPLTKIVITADAQVYTAPPPQGGTPVEILTAGNFAALLDQIGAYVDISYPYKILRGARKKRGWISANNIRATDLAPGEDEAVDYGTGARTPAEEELVNLYRTSVTSPLRLDGVPANRTLEDALRAAAATASHPVQAKNFTDSADQLAARRDALFRLIADEAIAIAQRALTLEAAASAFSVNNTLRENGYGHLATEVTNAVGARQDVLRNPGGLLF